MFNNKKWVFAYFIVILITWLLKTGSISGGDFALILVPLIPMVIGANSFDKSQWRKDDPTN